MGNVTIEDLKVVITGSREVDESLVRNIREFVDKIAPCTIQFMCGGAIGTDSIFVEEFAKINGAVTIYTPYIASRHLQLRSVYPDISIVETEARNTAFHKGMLLNRNRIMVEQSNAVILFKSNGKGGSWYTAQYALRKGIPVYINSGFREGDMGYEGNQLLLRYGCKKLSEFTKLLDI